MRYNINDAISCEQIPRKTVSLPMQSQQQNGKNMEIKFEAGPLFLRLQVSTSTLKYLYLSVSMNAWCLLTLTLVCLWIFFAVLQASRA
jgi:hypothetical protein